MTTVLKTDEELKEFIETIGIEYKYGCLREKDPEACFLLGHWFLSEKQDMKNYFETHLKACDELNYPKSCHQVGTAYLQGRGVSKEPQKALEYFTKGCLEGKGLFPLDHGIPCLMSGQLLLGIDESGKGTVKLDGKKGTEMLQRGCDAGLPDACELLHAVYLQGTSLVPKDQVKALSLAEKCCNMSNLVCCSSLYRMYKEGIGCSKDPEKAAVVKAKADELQDQLNIAMNSYKL